MRRGWRIYNGDSWVAKFEWIGMGLRFGGILMGMEVGWGRGICLDRGLGEFLWGWRWGEGELFKTGVGGILIGVGGRKHKWKMKICWKFQIWRKIRVTNVWNFERQGIALCTGLLVISMQICTTTFALVFCLKLIPLECSVGFRYFFHYGYFFSFLQNLMWKFFFEFMGNLNFKEKLLRNFFIFFRLPLIAKKMKKLWPIFGD